MRKGRSLVVGVVCGVVCVAGMMLYAHEIELNVEQERAEVLARYGSTQVEAYVATCDIAEGSKVDSTNVERRLMPGEFSQLRRVFTQVRFCSRSDLSRQMVRCCRCPMASAQ